jgi:hypothetical protein
VSEQVDRGELSDEDMGILACEVAGGNAELLQETLLKLQKFRIIEARTETGEIRFLAYDEEQYDGRKPSDAAEKTRERKRKQRETERDSSDVTRCHAPVTPMSRDVTRRVDEIRLDRPDIEEIRPDKNNAAGRLGEFLKAYPVKQKQLAASTEWAKLNPDNLLVGVILEAIEAQKNSEAWQKEGGKYIPLPHNWLKDQRWTDEVRKPVIGGLDATADVELERIKLRRQAREERNERRNPVEVLRSAQIQAEK